jgi:hypothetical protein
VDLQSVITGLVVGLGVSVATFLLTRRLERDRWDREDRIRREDLDRQATERWANERREMFGRLIRTTESLREEARYQYGMRASGPGDWLGAWREGYQVAVEIALVVPELGDLASAMHVAATLHVIDARRWNGRADPDSVPPSLKEREKPIDDASELFTKAAQDNLRTVRHDQALNR